MFFAENALSHKCFFPTAHLFTSFILFVFVILINTGRVHPPFWMFVTALRKDWALTDTRLRQSMIGIPIRRKRTRVYVRHQRRLKVLCERYVADRNMEDFLRAVGPTIRLGKGERHVEEP